MAAIREAVKRDIIFTTFKDTAKYTAWIAFAKSFATFYKANYAEKEKTIIHFINQGWDEENPGASAPEFNSSAELFEYVNADLEAIMAFCNLVLARKSLRPPNMNRTRLAEFSSLGWWKAAEDEDERPSIPSGLLKKEV